jgi:hypothetical protein
MKKLYNIIYYILNEDIDIYNYIIFCFNTKINL